MPHTNSDRKPCAPTTMARLIVTALALASLNLVGRPLGAQRPDSLSADSAFRRADWPTAERAYAATVVSAPQNGMAWLRLGIARQGQGRLAEAVEPFERALALRFQVPTATYRLARIHALLGNADRAFTYLDQLAPLGAVPVAIVDTLADFAKIRPDSRWPALIARMTALRYPCRTLPQARQFDFWIGDWDVTPFQSPPGPNAPLLGTNRIELQLEQCLLLEHWTAGPRGGGGGQGKSINFWDTNRGKWRQVWVADGGTSLDYEGEFRDSAMRFAGWTLGPNGARILQKLTFFPIHRDTVRQLFETSADSGRTWQPGFDGRYVRRR
jgi:hypothetical protein